MSSNKKILSIFGFLGILAGLLIVNMLFLKISKSIVEYSKPVPSKIQIESLAEKNQEINTNAKQTLENKIIESANGKEIISNIALYLDNKDKKDVGNKLNANEILNKNNIKAIEEVKQSAAFAPTNFLEINSQAANFEELNNQTIKERYPDFPSVDIDPPRESKDDPVPIPIIERNVSEPQVTVKAGNQTIKVNDTTVIIHSERNETTEITHESVSANATAAVVSDDKKTSVDVLQQNDNSTTIKISENRTIIIDLPNKNQEVTREEKLNNTIATPIVNDTKNVSSTEVAEQHQQANITSQDTIVVVHNNETSPAIFNSTATVNVTQEAHKEEQNVTIVNKTYSANVSATNESCDFEDEVVEDQITKEAEKTNVTESTHENDHKKQIHKTEHKEKHIKHEKHHKNHKKHGKRCRNKKHAHYIELSEDESTNLIQKSNILEKISQEKIVETVDGSSYTQAALSKMIVVDHIQTPKAEKADSEVLKAESQLAAEKPIEIAASAITQKTAINNADVKKIIRNNKNEETSSNRISVVASILSLFVFSGICLLGVEIYKNHQKANIAVIDPIEQVEMEKKYDYILLDSDLETQNTTREIGIQEI